MEPLAAKIRANPAGATSGPGYEQTLAAMATAQADKDMIRVWGKASNSYVVVNALADDLHSGFASRPRPDHRPPATLLFPDYVPLGAPPGGMRKCMARLMQLSRHQLVPITSSLHFIMLDQPAQFDAAVDGFLGRE